jgi:hypothetical protein
MQRCDVQPTPRGGRLAPDARRTVARRLPPDGPHGVDAGYRSEAVFKALNERTELVVAIGREGEGLGGAVQ